MKLFKQGFCSLIAFFVLIYLRLSALNFAVKLFF